MLASWCLVGIAGSKVGLRTNNNKRPRPPFSSPFLTTPIVPSLCRTNQTRHTALKKYLYKRPWFLLAPFTLTYVFLIESQVLAFVHDGQVVPWVVLYWAVEIFLIVVRGVRSCRPSHWG